MPFRKTSFLIVITILIFFTNIFAQDEVIVGEFGKYKISLDEFEYAYAKNAGGIERAAKDSLPQYKNFMDLYMKFRMKLRDAEVRAYDTDPDLMNELKDYQMQVGVSYILEKGINEPGIKKLFERRKEELRVSHLMIRPDSTGEAGAIAKAQAILDSINNGADWNMMVERYSNDQFSAPDGGDIYFVTAGVLPLAFEDAMYSLQPGEVYQKPVVTRYGVHLIKVTERIPRVPKIKASHVLIGYFNKEGKMDSSLAELRADSLLNDYNAGVPFEELVIKYSDDTANKQKGGDLGFFERRMMVKEFDEVAFKMDVGEVSDLVQTNFGYHLIMVTDKQTEFDFTAEEEGLRDIFKKQAYDVLYKELIDSLRKKYDYTLNESSVDLIIEQSDSVRFGMSHPRLDEIKDSELFTYGNKSVSAGEFLKAANSNSAFTGRPIFNKDELLKAIDKVSGEILLDEEALNLDKTNPEFAALMNDYKNGIFIFKLQEEEVWNKVKFDSADVYSYWEKNKEKYRYPDRVSFSEIFSMRDSLINKYFDMLQSGADFDSIAAQYTERPGKKQVKGFYELQDVNFSDLSKEANKIKNVDEYSEPVPFSGGYSIFQLKDRQPARIKTFEEAKAEVSGEYQEMLSKNLEQHYIKSLEDRYNPEINYSALEKAFKSN